MAQSLNVQPRFMSPTNRPGTAPLVSPNFMNPQFGAPAQTGTPQPIQSSVGLDFGTGQQGGFGEVGGPMSATTGAPAAQGGWMQKGKFGMEVAGTALGVYNALEQSKMNKFMQGYYGDQMDLQRTDFANAARSTNAELAARQERILSARGVATGSEESKAGVASHMDQWGVQENF